MFKYYLCIIILIFPFTSSASKTDSYKKSITGQYLLSNCTADKQTDSRAVIKSMHCAGYINGVFDSAQLIFGLTPESRLFCSPDTGISTKDQLFIVIKYLMENPKDLNNTARRSVLNAFIEAYPCK